MHLFCVLIGVVALVGTAVHAQPLSYDPYYVLPGGTGYASVDVGVRTIASPSKLKELKDASDIIAVAKFNPHARVEAGAHLTFGFFKDGSSNFASFVVGGKYQLGPRRAATANVVLPAGDIDNPGVAVGLMQTLEFGTAFRLNSHLQVAALKGYTRAYEGNGVVGNLLIEPALVVGEKLSAYLDLLISSNTSDLEDNLSVRLEPNLDIGLGDGMVLNAGVSVDLQGGDEREDLGLFIVLLRDM